MQKGEAHDRQRLIHVVTRNDTIGLVVSTVIVIGCLSIATYFVYTGRTAGALIGVLGLLPPIVGAVRGRRVKIEAKEQRR